jgi:ketosteroid isomerase-like protein
MSQENVDLAKALVPEPGTDIAAYFRDERAFIQRSEALSESFTDDFQSTMVFPGHHTETRAGVEGLRQNWLDWLEPWATYRTTLERAIDVGDRVVLLLRNHGRREDMDAEVELIAASICTIRDGKVARWEDWTDRGEALAAVGLSE